jgi:hypothetical protein
VASRLRWDRWVNHTQGEGGAQAGAVVLWTCEGIIAELRNKCQCSDSESSWLYVLIRYYKRFFTGRKRAFIEGQYM